MQKQCNLRIEMPPSFGQFQTFYENRVMQSVRIFAYKNVTKIVLFFAKCLDFFNKNGT